MKYELLDGTIIEITISDGYAGPDGKAGCQRNSHNIAWYRINGGAWGRSPFRSQHKTLEAIEISESLLDFQELAKFAIGG